MTNVITALHTMVYAHDPDSARAFIRDVLELPGVDVGGGWLIFKGGPSELGVHPSHWDGEAGAGGTDQRFDVSLICDDLDKTMGELSDKGAEFEGDVNEQSWGREAQLKVPGAGTITLYQPKYDSPATSL